MMGKKRGQITIFIIVGIILLFSTALIIYIRSRAVEEIPAAEIPEAIAEVPTELQPVNNYVLGCLRQTATNALVAIGAHGGYLGVTPEYTTEYGLPAFKFASQGMRPTEDDGLTVSPTWQVPYWFYMTSPNTCQAGCEFSNLIPPLTGTHASSVESQVQQYINKNIGNCLNNFAPLRRQGYTIVAGGDPSAAVQFGAKDVTTYLEYALHITKDGVESDIHQFLVRLDVPLRRIYELAYDVAKTQAELRFLDVHVLTLIAIYSGIDDDRLPPMAGTEFSFLPRFWLKSDVQQKLQDILTAQTSSLRVANTRNFVEFHDFGDNILKTTLYRKKTIPFAKTYPDLDVEFNYLNWPLHFYIMPGELIKPRESIISKLFMAIVPLQRYDLPYDVSYPSLVQVHDDYAFNGKGYDFFFGLEANVRNNAVLDNASVALTSPPLGGADSGQLCDPRQWNSGDYTFKVQDPRGNPIDGATVSFASSVQFCTVGTSENNAINTEARFAGNFPTGAIGALIVEKHGYTTHVQNYFNPQKENTELEPIVLKPAITKQIIGRKVNVDFLTIAYGGAGIPLKDWVMRPTDQPLHMNEKLIIIMERQKENRFEQDFIAFAEVVGSDMTKNITLMPGTYKLTAILLRQGEDVIIPEDHRCEGGVAGIGEECFTLPEVHLESGGRSEALQQATTSDEPVPPEIQHDLTTANQLPQPPEGVEDIGAQIDTSKVFLEGQYELQDVTITDDIYATNLPLKLTGISWNIVALPLGDRRHEHTEAMSKLQDMVNENPALFLPHFGVGGAAGGGAVG